MIITLQVGGGLGWPLWMGDCCLSGCMWALSVKKMLLFSSARYIKCVRDIICCMFVYKFLEMLMMLGNLMAKCITYLLGIVFPFRMITFLSIVNNWELVSHVTGLQSITMFVNWIWFILDSLCTRYFWCHCQYLLLVVMIFLVSLPFCHLNLGNYVHDMFMSITRS